MSRHSSHLPFFDDSEPRTILAGPDPSSPRFVAVDKPAGMLSVPGKGPEKQDCAASRIRFRYQNATGPLVVHRLDMDTSGVLLLALDAEAQRAISWQFEQRHVGKRYIALVRGMPPYERGEILAPMRLDPERRPLQVIDPERGKVAVTRYTVLSAESDRSRVMLEPLTGRTHQLRLHMAHLGCPILGDVIYGLQPGESSVDDQPRLMLHASELTFFEPGSEPRRAVTAVSPPPF